MLGGGLSYLICVRVYIYVCVQCKVTHQSNAVRPAHAHSHAQYRWETKRYRGLGRVFERDKHEGMSVCLWRRFRIIYKSLSINVAFLFCLNCRTGKHRLQAWHTYYTHTHIYLYIIHTSAVTTLGRDSSEHYTDDKQYNTQYKRMSLSPSPRYKYLQRRGLLFYYNV